MRVSSAPKAIARQGWWFFLLVAAVSVVTSPARFGLMLLAGSAVLLSGAYAVLRHDADLAVARGVFRVMLGMALLAGPAAYSALAAVNS